MTAKKKTGKSSKRSKALIARADAVRARLAQIGIDERDVVDAVAWARKVDPKSYLLATCRERRKPYSKERARRHGRSIPFTIPPSETAHPAVAA